jgi:hypothetical protein
MKEQAINIGEYINILQYKNRETVLKAQIPLHKNSSINVVDQEFFYFSFSFDPSRAQLVWKTGSSRLRINLGAISCTLADFKSTQSQIFARLVAINERLNAQVEGSNLKLCQKGTAAIPQTTFPRNPPKQPFPKRRFPKRRFPEQHF